MIDAKTVREWAVEAAELAKEVGGRFFHDLAANLDNAAKHLEGKEVEAAESEKEAQRAAKPKHR